MGFCSTVVHSFSETLPTPISPSHHIQTQATIFSRNMNFPHSLNRTLDNQLNCCNSDRNRVCHEFVFIILAKNNLSQDHCITCRAFKEIGIQGSGKMSTFVPIQFLFFQMRNIENDVLSVLHTFFKYLVRDVDKPPEDFRNNMNLIKVLGRVEQSTNYQVQKIHYKYLFGEALNFLFFFFRNNS